MKLSELTDEELQLEFIKVEQRHSMMVRVTPTEHRLESPFRDIRNQLNEILLEFQRRKKSVGK